MSRTRKRGVAATPDGLVKLEEAKAAKRNERDKPWTYRDIADKAGFSDISTVKKFFGKKGSNRKVDRSYAAEIVKALDLELFEIVDREDWDCLEETDSGKLGYWRTICRQNLPLQKDLTTTKFGVAKKLDNLYVPLAIVERKQSKPRFGNQQEEKKEEKEKEKETLISIAEDRFFEEVLRQGQSEKSQGRRIAIIGEPGSGKTTRLQKIADWILEQELGLPIWISLADFTQPTIPHYIEEIWLKQAGLNLLLEALAQHKDRIWLLLDGLDEMTARVETCHVSQLLRGWLENARVIVTCRVNVWEADKNAFSGFDVFRNLPFETEQVELFIRRFFDSQFQQ